MKVPTRIPKHLSIQMRNLTEEAMQVLAFKGDSDTDAIRVCRTLVHVWNQVQAADAAEGSEG